MSCNQSWWTQVLWIHFVYVDDILVLSEHPSLIMDGMNKEYHMKEGSISKLTMYLGVMIKEHKLPNNPSKTVWSMTSEKYLKEAIWIVKQDLLQFDVKLPPSKPTPLSSGYWPELDVSSLLDNDQTNWYQRLIGILRWVVELGRVDIHFSMAIMAQYMVQPHSGHLDQLFQIFTYLKSHIWSRIILDDTVPHFDETQFVKADWSCFYLDACEAIPPNVPKGIQWSFLVLWRPTM